MKKLIAIACAACLAAGPALSDEAAPGGADAVCRFLETCRAEGGAYAWPGDDVGHLATTHAAAMTYRLLGRTVPGTLEVPSLPSEQKGVCWRTRNHAATLYHYLRMQRELGREVSVTNAPGANPIDSYLTGYEEKGNPILVEMMNKLELLAAGGGLAEDVRRAFADYLARRRRPNGSYNTTVVADESPEGKVCGHIVNTWWALRGLRLIGGKPDGGVVAFVRGCRNPDGAYTWTDRASARGRVSDVTYTLAAVKILVSLGRRPADEPALVAWLAKLRNADGGFGDRPGARSDPLATHAAVDALATLGRLDVLDAPLPPPRPEPAVDPSLHAWTIQFEAPGSGSIREAVEVARLEKIHLWGAKNADPAWIAAAQAEADRRGVPVTFFPSDERYGRRREIPGLGNFSHCIDPVTPPPDAADQRTFQLWQICDHECLARVFLDSGDYEAIGTFHFGCFDMTWLLPFVRRYEGTLALVSNQDSHGETWWWREQLRAFRTVFLAGHPTFDAFRAACRKGLVASVRKDVHTADRLRLIGVRPAVRDALLACEREWTANPVRDDPVSIQVLTPSDRFEVARPAKGRLLRVRYERPWVEGRGLQAANYRLEDATFGGRVRTIRRVERRHEAKDWMHGILEDAYDLVDLPEGKYETVSLRFARRDGTSFVRTVRLRP